MHGRAHWALGTGELEEGRCGRRGRGLPVQRPWLVWGLRFSILGVGGRDWHQTCMDAADQPARHPAALAGAGADTSPQFSALHYKATKESSKCGSLRSQTVSTANELSQGAAVVLTSSCCACPN